LLRVDCFTLRVSFCKASMHCFVRQCIDAYYLLLLFIASSLHRFIASLLHYFIVRAREREREREQARASERERERERERSSLLHCFFITSLLHCFITSLLRYFVVSLFRCFVAIASLLHCFIGFIGFIVFIASRSRSHTSLLHCFIASLNLLHSLLRCFVASFQRLRPEAHIQCCIALLPKTFYAAGLHRVTCFLLSMHTYYCASGMSTLGSASLTLVLPCFIVSIVSRFMLRLWHCFNAYMLRN
jgi:hypothetical protein